MRHACHDGNYANSRLGDRVAPYLGMTAELMLLSVVTPRPYTDEFFESTQLTEITTSPCSCFGIVTVPLAVTFVPVVSQLVIVVCAMMPVPVGIVARGAGAATPCSLGAPLFEGAGLRRRQRVSIRRSSSRRNLQLLPTGASSHKVAPVAEPASQEGTARQWAVPSPFCCSHWAHRSGTFTQNRKRPS